MQNQTINQMDQQLPFFDEQVNYLDDAEGYTPGQIQIDEHGRLYSKYVHYEKFLSFIPRGMDNWIINIIPRQIATRTLRVDDADVYFENPFLEKPMLSTPGQAPQRMWPEVARRRLLDYSGALYVDLVKVRDGEEIERVEKVFIGMLPIMIGSQFDNLYGLNDIELLSKGECPSDPGCYFIARGAEKVVLFDEKLAAMKMLLYITKTKVLEVISSMTIETMRGSTKVDIVRNRNNTLHLRLSTLGKNTSVNLLSIFSALGIRDPNEALRFIIKFTRDEWADKVLGKLNATFLEFREVGDPIIYIAKVIPSREKDDEVNKKIPIKDRPYTEQENIVLDLLRRDLYPQLPSNPDNDRRRLAMLAQQAVRILEYMAGFRKLDDRDDWGNKRLDPASESFRQLFQSAFKIMVDNLEEEIAKKNYTQLATIAQKIKTKTITEAFSRSISSNSFGIKGLYQKNIVDQLKNANLLDAFSHLSRVRVRGQEKSHVTGPRMVQPTASGFICPAETPEREGCGIIKNTANTTILTIHDPDTDLLITQTVLPNLAEDRSEYYDSKCWFNGTFLGWCPGALQRELLVTDRRNRVLPLMMSVVLNLDRILSITTTSSRVSRPLLIVNPVTRRLVVDEKGLWNADFETIINEGAAEYLDAYEQNIHAYIAESIGMLDSSEAAINQAFLVLGRAYANLQLAKGSRDFPDELMEYYTPEEFEGFLNQGTTIPIDVAEQEVESATQSLAQIAKKGEFTHCELDPQSVWGFAGSMIDLPNHNMGPRNTYQCNRVNSLIETPTGLRTIGSLKDGDLVVTIDPMTGFRSITPIKNHFVIDAKKNGKTLYRITLVGGRSVEATQDHPFLTFHHGWVKVENLDPKKHRLAIDPRTSSKEFEDKSLIDLYTKQDLLANGIVYLPIASITPIDNDLVSDFETESPNHTFITEDGFVSHNCAMGKQSLGISNSHQRYRFPTSTKRLGFPTHCVFETQMAKLMGFHDLPAGTTATIAIIADPWNQEDAYVFNEAALQRGLFRYIKEISKSATEKKEDKIEEIIGRPPIRPGEPPERYSNLDSNGLIRVGSVVNPRDAIIGRIRRNILTGQEENATIFASENEHGIVEEVLVTTSREGKKIVNVKIRDTRIPKRGDKFALRPSQKGTVGIVLPEIDMPRSPSGMVPDLVMNPLAFPSRMTMGTLIEILGSKVAVMTGNRINATAFRDVNLNSLMEMLATLGYDRKGDEVLYSGTTGRQYVGTIFTGVAYVQKLKHDAEDKIQARAKGAVVPTTHQPTRGKAQGGGQKFGEMEGWAMMSHGAAGVLKEKLCDASDATQVVFCTTCGTIAISNHVDAKYECRLCGTKGSFARGTIPYVQKLMDQYLYGLNMGMKYGFRKID